MALATIDMSAAFDVVNHELLIKRLYVLGLPPNLIKLLENWLTGRLFYCRVNDSNSMMIEIDAGTVQDSILGPILYGIFTSPLGDLTIDLVTFADNNYQLGDGKGEQANAIIENYQCFIGIVRNLSILRENSIR